MTASRSAEQPLRTASSTSFRSGVGLGGELVGRSVVLGLEGLQNAAFSGLSDEEFQAAPTTPSAAPSPASAMSRGLLNPLPPMIGTSMPSSRAWVTSGIAASMRADTTSASASLSSAWVSSASKSVSAFEKVMVSAISTPSSSSAPRTPRSRTR